MVSSRDSGEEDLFDTEVFNKNFDATRSRVMDGMTVIYIGGSVVVLLLLLGCCCRRRKYRGQVIAVPVVATYPRQNANTSFPAPYPVAAPYPNTAPYPTVTPYPTAAPYPTTAPYNTAPYPTQGAPHPTQDAPYPQPSAPESHALPPTYEQAVGGAGKMHQ